jgi:hypothetical protein
MKPRRLILTLAAFALLCSVTAAPVAMARTATSAGTPGTVTQAVTGTINNGGTFSGTLTVTRFVQQNGNLAAVGTITGTLTNATGGTVGTVTAVPVTIPVAAAGGTCQILHLTLGPLDLNLLGLMVHLNQVVLDITAQQGPGNLLGNLLCGVAGLLDNNGSSPLAGLVQLLNQLLAHL